jgi:hypothetical protein
VIELLMSKHGDHRLILTGDFNLPDCDWRILDGLDNSLGPDRVQISNNLNNEGAAELADMANYFGLFQINNILNKNDRVLDLVFASSSETPSVSRSSSMLLPIDTHHPPLDIVISSNVCGSGGRSMTKRNFHKADYSAVNAFLESSDFSFFHTYSDINTLVEKYHLRLQECVEACIPIKSIKQSHYPKWFSAELVQLIVEKKMAHRRHKETADMGDYNYFAKLRSECSSLSKTCYRQHIESVENDLPKDSRGLWKFVSALREDRVDIPSKLHYNNHQSDSPQSAANLFASFFQEVYETPSVHVGVDFSPDKTIDLPNVTLSIDEVTSAILALDTSKAAGPDGIPNVFIKYCVTILASTPLIQ